jgi:hypothetical protein
MLWLPDGNGACSCVAHNLHALELTCTSNAAANSALTAITSEGCPPSSMSSTKTTGLLALLLGHLMNRLGSAALGRKLCDSSCCVSRWCHWRGACFRPYSDLRSEQAHRVLPPLLEARRLIHVHELI